MKKVIENLRKKVEIQKNNKIKFLKTKFLKTEFLNLILI